MTKQRKRPVRIGNARAHNWLKDDPKYQSRKAEDREDSGIDGTSKQIKPPVRIGNAHPHNWLKDDPKYQSRKAKGREDSGSDGTSKVKRGNWISRLVGKGS